VVRGVVRGPVGAIVGWEIRDLELWGWYMKGEKKITCIIQEET
jgi:hypothetical protein